MRIKKNLINILKYNIIANMKNWEVCQEEQIWSGEYGFPCQALETSHDNFAGQRNKIIEFVVNRTCLQLREAQECPRGFSVSSESSPPPIRE